jgi:hypothetical protein
MVANEILENYYNFYPIWVPNASIHVKKVHWYSSQKR